LFEEWIVGDPVDSEDFSLARESGVILASLHEQNLRARGPKVDRVPQQRLLERVAGCARWIDELPPRPAVAPTCWVHGDFHPDQHTRGEAGLRLLDLDALRPGVPEEDIASWIADHLVVEPDASGRDAAALLLEGYGSGRSKLDAALLGRLVADELLLRAAAGLRRMQVGAEARALLLLERAAQALEEELLG
jgi:aminoglycoside phosphotransferase (APT) family kinase protein